MMAHGKQRYEASKTKPVGQRLWWIATAPSLWALHFLTCYVTVAIWCEKVPSDEPTNGLWWLIGMYSVVAMFGIAIVGWLSFKSFRQEDPPLPYDFDDPDDRTNFLGFTAFLLALLSGVATLFTTLVFVLVRSCD